MKRFLYPAWVALLATAGWTSFTQAQESGDAAAAAQAESSVLSEGEVPGDVTHDGVIYDGMVYDGVVGEGMYLGDATGQHADGHFHPGHIAREVVRGVHPHPVYAHSKRGAHATWTHQWNQQQAMMRPWHGHYYHRQYGAPLALIVPPTAAFQSNYSWGVGQTTSTPIYHQFARPYPGPASGAAHGMYPTPYWPSNTNQFGVYYIRGPW